ncbi:MAG TPA: lactate utilization protein, partial [Spirochaetes bacterium]|nr:lactate utilization protein [Spirochaetota bacterium]
DGRMVNIDGMGNRVAAAIYGPSHIVAVIGANKIVPDLDNALWRIKNVAAPQNTRRLGIKTPCASLGHCTDCGPAVSICRVTTIMDYRPPAAPYTVILTPINLGY